MTWLDPSELRVGLGCMRLSTDDTRDDARGAATIAAAAEAGITVFDTAHAYGRDQSELGHNERLLAGGLRSSGRETRARIVTKGGMKRAGSTWIPDGRAKAIRADCEASLVALDGLPIDLYLLHAPDPSTPWATSVRALAKLADEGVVRGVGLSNINRRQLDEALELAPVAAVEVALSVFEDRPVRGGIVERCAEIGIAVIAHSPLGGPRRAHALARRGPLAEVAADHGATAAEVALAWLLELAPNVVAIPGARRPETARSAARAATLGLTAEDRLAIDRAFTAPRRSRHGPSRAPEDSDVLLVMGIPGAGKTRLAEQYVARGYTRLNRDERGGGLRELADSLDHELSSGAPRVVLDNSYLTRAARSYTIEAATRHGIAPRCVWIDIPLAQAQVNLVERLLDRAGELPTPDELRALARREPGILAPTSQMRALRELEPPSTDEGLASVERRPFERMRATARANSGTFVAAAAMRAAGWEQTLARADRNRPLLIFDWATGSPPDVLEPLVDSIRQTVDGPVESALCPHEGGPPRCWCRPPLPGLPLAFARRHGIDPSHSTLIGTGSAHRTLARTLGADYVLVRDDE
jgi:aryl-alcohol dehydrogenase-like predicted oxidoreductase